MSQAIIDLLNKAAEANTKDAFREDNVVNLPPRGTLVISGDIHGHQRNLQRIKSFVDLENNPGRHVILQEIIHGGQQDQYSGCLSYKALFDVAGYKLKYPDRVHLLLSNHGISFINNTEILKDGKEMNLAMRRAIDREFGGDAENVKSAISRFLFSQPLAVKCSNGIWVSHSLPPDRLMDKFDPTVFHRPLKIEDTVKPGSAYLLTWGRDHSQQLLDRMAKMLNVDLFVLGHQPQYQGWHKAGENLLIITSEHDHGCLLPVDLEKNYTIQNLVDALVPLASIA